ncbi:sensor histidine kinase [Citrobacter braakii]|jgi:two-component system sensor histidine kinase TctE|uniref:sensor histidine kinase n=1 Tax=Citrobacter TaxID=544 RepID=UPI0015EAF0A1|nr:MULTISPECIES: sensor histidine kinase [Citrobacter]MCI1668654.1 sensor histidine kinase [Citrobacter freundii]MCI1824708.1 sensor histidine kinase [Citrobacter freundii]MDT7114058.1 sensor histidine kinase [Citrobacter braakii]QLS64091.1 sensor histidine kinase [Citrobacter sp. RHBSTW-00881]
MKWVKPQSLYLQLLMFLGLPLMLLWGLSAFNSYVSALQAATQAYDRTLLSSARTVSERLVVHNKQLEVNVPWVVLDSFELNMNDRLYYKVVDPAGKVISGYDDLPAMPPATSRTRLYPALAWFYHTEYRGEAIRVARLLQPVNEGGIIGMAEIYVAETLQSRRYLARQLLFSSWVSQGLLVLLTLVLVGWLLRRVLRPMRQLSSLMVRREPGLLTPLPELLPWSETRLLIVAFNRYLDRLRGLISRQERFSADASHQLKTPLAVLKTQAAVALASQQPQQWYESLQAMSSTLDNTIQLTERLLQLSAVKRKEQGERHFSPVNLYEVVQSSCFTRLAQARSKGIDLGYEGEQNAVWIEGDEVLLGELCGNLLDNALKYTPPHGVVTARLLRKGEAVVLVVEDSGPGIDEQMVHQALLPFHRLDNVGNVPGAGIGLALVNDIARLHRTHPQLSRSEALGGLSVRLRFLCLVRDAQDDQHRPAPVI